MRVARASLIILVFTGSVGRPVSTQVAAGEQIGLEVVSIKPSNKDATSTSGGFLPGGRFGLVNSPIAALIRQAYPSDSTQLIGAPAWVTSERYDVTVVATGEPTREAFRELLRAVLAQRFKLVSHYEEQPREAYALVLARADGRLGPELRKYPFDCVAYLEQQGPQDGATPPLPASGAPPCGSASDTGVIRSGGVNMATLARMVSGPAGRRVVDKTGLPGHYEFTLKYTPRTAASSAAPTDGAPSIFTALQEQLGLKLNPEQALSRVVVIDSIAKPEPD